MSRFDSRDALRQANIWPNQQFWIGQTIWMLGTAILMLWAFRQWPIDEWAIAPFAGEHAPFFVHRNDWALTHLAHDGIKKIVILIGLMLAIPLIGSRWRQQWQVWRWPAGFVLLGMLLGPSVVGILKATSAHSCPWHLAEYGGTGGFLFCGAAGQYPLGMALCIGRLGAGYGHGHRADDAWGAFFVA